MTTTGTIILVLVIIAIAIVAFFLFRIPRSARLKDKFGPEYDRTVEASGSKRRAETMLSDREKRVSRFHIRSLTPDERDPFQKSWRSIQAEFVDEPRVAVLEADDLIGKVMSARGYPMESFEQSSADLSVDHPRVVDYYRAGHDIVLRHSRGQATTEDLRRAMIHYRLLFDELIQEPAPAHAQAARYERKAS